MTGMTYAIKPDGSPGRAFALIAENYKLTARTLATKVPLAYGIYFPDSHVWQVVPSYDLRNVEVCDSKYDAIDAIKRLIGKG